VSAASLLLAVAGAYLLGSIPFAIVVSRAMRLPDPRAFGSGNPGATNVLRSGSRVGALLTLVGDASKGAIAALVARALAEAGVLDPSAPAWAALAAFFGHLFPVFLGFRGGKGVATFLGTLLALVPIVGVATCLLWLGVAALFRYASLASMVSAVCAALALWRVGGPPGVGVAVALMAALLVWRHGANLDKLIHGTESKIGAKAASKPDSAT
jgi:acyl phosphate:glycerol-3-phosphate acyltransferase